MTQKFTSKQGLMVAAGLAEPIPKEVGTLGIYAIEWDWTNPESQTLDYKRMDTHPCSKEELGHAQSIESLPHLFK